MKIEPREIAEIAEIAATQSPAPRVDLYAGIHKALRAFMADTLLGLGRMDVEDDLDFAQGCQRVAQLLDVCQAHLEHENTFVHPAIEARAQGGSLVVADEHEEHERSILRLVRAVADLMSCARADRAPRTQALYHALALFVAHNFEHMHLEETAHNAALWQHYTDDELMAVHGALVSSIPPGEMMLVMRWMVPFMAPAERVALLGGMRQQAPGEAFGAVLDVVRPHLTAREWDKLMAGLGMAAAAMR